MRRRVAISLIGVSSCLLACTSPLSPTEVLELGRAERRWAARQFDAYTFEYRVSCGLCPPFFYQLTRVSVYQGQVYSVVYVANDSALAPEESAYFPSVDSLFAEIRRLPHEDWVRDVKVEYDPALGYPTLIEAISHPNIADAGGAEYIRNLVPQYVAFDERAMKSRFRPSRPK